MSRLSRMVARLEAWVTGPDDLYVAGLAEGELPPSSTRPAMPSTYRASTVAKSVALQIPAMRRARHALMTPATFALVANDRAGNRLDPFDARCAWMAQPERNRIRYATLARLIDDGLWFDKAVVRATRTIYGTTAYFERIHPQRWQPIYEPNDPDTVAAWHIDGKPYDPAQFAAAGFAAFDFADLGGLRRLGMPLLQLYADLQAAAGRYARAPHPYAILRNVGPDLTRDEIDALLDEWELAREQRGIGFTNDAVEYDVTTGYSARDLQLVETREHSALEVARLLQLPAFAVDAKSGDSMTYGNIIDRRKDLVEALRPWSTVLTQTMSLDIRTPSGITHGGLLPRGVTADLDPADYLRADAEARMRVWQLALEIGLLDLDDVAAQEPLARKRPTA